MIRTTFSGAALAVLVALPASAQEACGPVPDLVAMSASRDEIRCALLLNRAHASARAITIVATEAEVESVGFAIGFAFNSADLTPEARMFLDEMAAVIGESVELAALGYFIDGHTDATGSAEYNLGLGQARADATAAYLASALAFPLKVETRSFGETRLSDPADPAGAVNRRVEITPVPIKE